MGNIEARNGPFLLYADGVYLLEQFRPSRIQ